MRKTISVEIIYSEKQISSLLNDEDFGGFRRLENYILDNAVTLNTAEIKDHEAINLLYKKTAEKIKEINIEGLDIEPNAQGNGFIIKHGIFSLIKIHETE